MSSCKKQNTQPIAEFTLNVSSFTIKSVIFKSSETDEFSAFAHVYPTNSSVLFTGTNGESFQFYTGDYTLETFKFALPVGTYTINGNGGDNDEGSTYMSYEIPSQSITVASQVTSISITINPTCCLILVADPNSLIDTTSEPRLDTRNTNGNQLIYMIDFNTTLKYLYVVPTDISNFMILKKDSSQLVCNPTSACFSIGYIYKILLNNGSTTTILNPVFQNTTTISF